MTPAELYLNLLKRSLTRHLGGEGYAPIEPPKPALRRAFWTTGVRLLRAALSSAEFRIFRPAPFDGALRAEGRDWPAEAETMIGLKRLDNIHDCITDVLRHQVPGDFIETGAWRGGATIFMRAVLKAYGVTDRIVWVADSFEGLPRPDPTRYSADAGHDAWRSQFLAVSVDEVKRNFAKYGVLDEQVRFLVGWFRDTLPRAPITALAVLRLDGDMYESTIVALRHLYPKLSVGGYVIIDDYGAVHRCRAAVEDFRREQAITEPLSRIDWTGVFWRRAR